MTLLISYCQRMKIGVKIRRKAISKWTNSCALWQTGVNGLSVMPWLIAFDVFFYLNINQSWYSKLFHFPHIFIFSESRIIHQWYCLWMKLVFLEIIWSKVASNWWYGFIYWKYIQGEYLTWTFILIVDSWQDTGCSKSMEKFYFQSYLTNNFIQWNELRNIAFHLRE